ncbi:MAG: hypothetical protein PHN37_02345 [Candidatus Pacebacteria bacterium]|nr:hypothetical protein [Candidatus Paceibacterota bacterium]
MKKIFIIIIVIVIISLFFLWSKREKNNDFIQCLEQAGVVIYASKTCPACAKLVKDFVRQEIINPIYVDCGEQGKRCQ